MVRCRRIRWRGNRRRCARPWTPCDRARGSLGAGAVSAWTVLDQLLDAAAGAWSACVQLLDGTPVYDYAADVVRPSASLIKVPLAMALVASSRRQGHEGVDL